MNHPEQPTSASPFPSEVIALAAVYFFVTFLVRLALPPGLRMDESQQVFLSQWLTAGYDAQPPLYNWVQRLVFELTQNYVLGLAALKGVVLAAVIATYAKLAHMVLKDRAFTLMATLGLFLTPQFFWQAQRDLSHTTATLLFVNLTLMATVRTVERPATINYLLLGAAIGLGMLTKYNFALFVAGLAVATVLTRQGRQSLLNWRFALTILIAGLVFLPHAIWLFNHLAVASSVTVARMAEDAGNNSRSLQILIGLANLVLMTAIAVAPAVILFGLAFGRPTLHLVRRPHQWDRFFTLLPTAILMILVVLILATTFTTFRDRWLLPLLQYAPISLCLLLQAAGVDAERGWQRIWRGVIIMALAIPVALLVVGLADKTSHYRKPYGEFTAQLRRELPVEPGLIITNDWHTAGNMKAQWPAVPVMAVDFPNLQLTPIAGRPILLVWRDDADLPASIQTWLSTNLGRQADTREARALSLPYTGGDDSKVSSFHYILLAP
ncbi:glycosyltransferase family 39 protein [Rhizobium sp. FY34]|uniref:glycosyltransferase family 39 protein n=1 Tax=Rhizobium sp. FY34 TaxID=2562309 RepID=UPI0010C10536|nr:glycosyltransferase family 39 protein [Rhizobium sp. FY34]